MESKAESYQEILKRKKEHYGNTEAAYEFAAEEYASQQKPEITIDQELFNCMMNVYMEHSKLPNPHVAGEFITKQLNELKTRIKPESELQKENEILKQQIVSKSPKYNGKPCSEGCNCLDIAEHKAMGGVKDYPCMDNSRHIEMLKPVQQNTSYTKQDLIDLVQSLKDYTHESGKVLGHDDREAFEFVDIYLKNKKP